jgi:hypothetical protein
MLRWVRGSWGLILSTLLSTTWLVSNSEPDFERLFPISTYERVHQTLIKVWEQQNSPAQQVVQLTKLIGLIGELQRSRSQLWETKQNRSDLDYQVRLLDYIELDFSKNKLAKNRAIQDQDFTGQTEQVIKLLALVRLALENLT